MKNSTSRAALTSHYSRAIVAPPGSLGLAFIMKITIIAFALSLLLGSFLGPGRASAAAYTFSNNLSYHGVQSAADVTALQQFLTDQGVYTGPITGSFLKLTYKGVIAFQNKQGITPASGFFGPVTRAAANAVLATTQTSSVTGTVTLDATTSGATDSLSASVYRATSTRTSYQAQLDALYARLRGLQSATKTVTTPVTTPPSVPTPTPAVTTPAPTSSGIAWGAYTGDTVSALGSLEFTVGKQSAYQAIFWGWDDTFPTTFNGLPASKTLVIFWEPSFNYDAINDGSKDAYIASFAQGAKTYAASHNVILVPFSEMNLGEEVWGDTGSNTPAKFAAAYKRIHDIFVQNGATNVKFGIAYNNESTGSHTAFNDYYPGSSYVDYVGVDGFNFGTPWTQPSSLFAGAISKLTAYGKPLIIFSTASAAGSQKAAWITAFGSYVKTVPNLRGFIWFNQNKEQNWLVNSDAAALAAFTTII